MRDGKLGWRSRHDDADDDERVNLCLLFCIVGHTSEMRWGLNPVTAKEVSYLKALEEKEDEQSQIEM